MEFFQFLSKRGGGVKDPSREKHSTKFKFHLEKEAALGPLFYIIFINTNV